MNLSTAIFLKMHNPSTRLVQDASWPRYSAGYFSGPNILVMHPIPWLDLAYPEREKLIQQQQD